MVNCIQTHSVPTKDFDNTVLSLRLTGAEAVRFWSIMDAAKARNPYAGKSDIYRELLGLTPPNALTAEEINFFRSGKRVQKGIPVAPRSKHPIPLINGQQKRRKQGG